MADTPKTNSRSIFHRMLWSVLRWLRRHRFKFEIFFFIIVLLAVFFWQSIVVTIQSGEAGVLYLRFKGGTVTDRTYAEGIHLIFPWDTMYVYDVRVQQVQSTFSVLSLDGLWVEMTISIRYRPLRESLGALHVTLGPDYMEKVILPEVQSVLRIIIGQLHPEDIFTTDRNFLDIALQESLLQTAEKFIRIDDLLITNVTLPPIIQKAIERKLERKQIAQEYIYRLLESELEAKRKKIEAQGIHDFQEIVAEGISEQLLAWRGIEATLKLAESNNAKILIIGNNENGLPIIFNADSANASQAGIGSASSVMSATDAMNHSRSFYNSTTSSFSNMDN